MGNYMCIRWLINSSDSNKNEFILTKTNMKRKRMSKFKISLFCFVLNQQEGDRRENDAELETSSGTGGGVPTCRRHKLQVNFADIGWSHWIISPQTFEAHYCAGSCPYPLTKVCSTPCEGVWQCDTAFAL